MAISAHTLNPSAPHSALARAVHDFERIRECVAAFFATSATFLDREEDDDFASRLFALEARATAAVIAAPAESAADIDAKAGVLRVVLAQDLEHGGAEDGRALKLMDSIRADMERLCYSQSAKRVFCRAA